MLVVVVSVKEILNHSLKMLPNPELYVYAENVKKTDRVSSDFFYLKNGRVYPDKEKLNH